MKQLTIRQRIAEGVALLARSHVGPTHELVSRYGAIVRDMLATANIRFGQVERAYSECRMPQPHGLANRKKFE